MSLEYPRHESIYYIPINEIINNLRTFLCDMETIRRVEEYSLVKEYMMEDQIWRSVNGLVRPTE